jgi:lactoylglutathione lyase
MNQIIGLDHIGVRVADFKRAISFYKQFGFEVIREDFNERVVVLLHNSGVALNLLDFADKRREQSNVLMDEDDKHAGFTHIAFRVTDIDLAVRDIRKLGIDITEGPVTFGDGKTSVFFRDPDRNVIELTRPASYNARPAEKRSTT